MRKETVEQQRIVLCVHEWLEVPILVDADGDSPIVSHWFGMSPETIQLYKATYTELTV